jgi:Raf kinase inhibitor-like YbhB/YbcL family protein
LHGRLPGVSPGRHHQRGRAGSVVCNSLSLLLGTLIFFLPATGCNRGGNEPAAPLSIQLTSPDLTAGAVSKASTCDGQGSSPQLSWNAPPAGTQSLALVVTDRDSSFGYNFIHWVLYNIPANTRELPSGLPAQSQLADGAEQGLNDNDKPGYTPPCPPGKSAHRYDFVLYAVDMKVNLPSASKKQLLNAISGHVLAKGELIARYGRE